MRRFSGWLSALFLLLAGPAAAQDRMADPGVWMAHYYENPQPGRMTEWVQVVFAQGFFAKPSSRFPMMIFLSEVLAQNPDEVGHWCREWASLPEQERVMVAWSIRNANVAAQESCIRKDLGLSSDQIDKLLKTPRHDPLTREARTPSDLDMLWAVFVATGNPAAVNRIIDVLGRPLPEENAPRSEMPLLLHGAAKWSLGSNIRQHASVAKIAKARLETATGSLQGELEAVVRKAEQVPASETRKP